MAKPKVQAQRPQPRPRPRPRACSATVGVSAARRRSPLKQVVRGCIASLALGFTTIKNVLLRSSRSTGPATAPGEKAGHFRASGTGTFSLRYRFAISGVSPAGRRIPPGYSAQSRDRGSPCKPPPRGRTLGRGLRPRARGWRAAPGTSRSCSAGQELARIAGRDGSLKLAVMARCTCSGLYDAQSPAA